MRYTSRLTNRQIAEIQDLWRRRTTIASLAEAYSITPDEVRTIIARPGEEVMDN